MVKTIAKTIIFFSTMVFLSGCGVVSDSIPALVEIEDPDKESVSVYQNTLFGYSFETPHDAVLYAIDLTTQSAVNANEQSEIIFVPGESTNYLTARVVVTQQSTNEWLTDNLRFFYPEGIASQKVADINGHQTIVLRGDGTTKSPALLMTVQGDGKLLIITFERREIGRAHV